jgi:hypothetical protein
VLGHVADEALLGLVVEDFLSEVARGVEVFWADLGEEGHGFAYEMAMRLVEVDGTVAEFDRVDGREVIGAGALVVKCHCAVALEIGDAVGGAGGVDRELLVVDAYTVAVGVWVGEEAGLEDWVWGGFDTGDQVGWVEGYLFDLGEVVLCVLVEGEDADFAEGNCLCGQMCVRSKTLMRCFSQSSSAWAGVMVWTSRDQEGKSPFSMA